jgi:lysozyme family protein
LSNFDDAFEALIGHEGGYVNDRRDPGGETKFGVSKRSYPAVDIKALTLDGAKAIYKRDFWDKVRGDELPMPIAFNLFDGAVNSGPAKSIMWMQRAADVADDGKLGPMTLAALLAGDPLLLAARYNGIRLKFMTDLSTWPTFGKGWARRIAGNLMK